MSEQQAPENSPEPPPPGAPQPVEDRPQTGSLRILENGAERLRNLVRRTFGVLLGCLIVANVATYSLYQSLLARVDSQEHRIERLNKMVTDMLAANENARKIEKMQQQVTGIEGQVTDMADTVKQQDAMAEKPAPEPDKKGRKGR